MSASLYDVSIWEEIKTSVCWKTNRLVEGIHKEIPKDTALAEFQGQQPIPWQLPEIVQQRAETWVQRVYDICCSVYEDRGKAASEDFDRAVWAYWVEPFIMGQKEADIHHETMSGFLELLLCAVGSPREKRPFLKVSQKDCCLQVRTNVFNTWHARLHDGPRRVDEAAAALTRYSEVQTGAPRMVAGLPQDSPPLQPPTQTPVVAEPAALPTPHAAPVSGAPQDSPSARADRSSTVLPPSALEPGLPPSIPIQEGPAPGPPTVSASDMIARSSGASTATWENIEISFLSDERIQIRNGTMFETRNYGEFGFEDHRSGKPNQAWLTLRALAEGHGRIQAPTKAHRGWSQVEKRIQEIREVLRDHFGIPYDPIPYVKGTGYRALFKIDCRASYKT